jgi:hypothetical protein
MGVGAMPAAAPKSPSAGPPKDFGRGVNDYLNHYVTVADGKAAALLAADVGLAVVIAGQTTFPTSIVLRVAMAIFAVSAVFCATVVFPRLPSGRTGLIFWEDIRRRASVSDYQRDLMEATEEIVEREYAAQNWYVSRVLHTKHRRLQLATVMFVAALLAAAISTIR